MNSHSTWMLVTAILYWAACIGVGIYSNRRGAAKSAQDFFVAGRGLGTFVLAFALMSTTLSAWLMLGHQGLMYASGLPYLVYYIHIPLMGVVGLLIFTRQWLLGKKMNYISPGQMYAGYYESSDMLWITALVTVLYCIPYSALQLTGAGYVFSVLTGGAIPFLWGAWIMVIVVVVYVLLGGIHSTALVDAAQGVLLVIGLIAICGTVLANVGPTEILTKMQSFDPKLLTLPGGNNLWTWTYIMSLALSTCGIYLSPAFTIWSFSAKTPKIFRWQAIWVWVLLIGVVYYIASPLIGMGGRVLFPDLVKTDTLTPTIMVQLMPVWIYVIVGIGLLAAMNSTAAGYLITCGVIFSQDVYKAQLKSHASEKELVLVSRLVIIAIVGIAFFLSSVWKEELVLMGTLATAFGVQLAPALIGILYWRKATKAGAFWGIVVGLIVSYLTYAVWKYPLHIHSAMWGLGANLLVFFFCSLVAKTPSKETLEKHDEIFAKGMRAYQKNNGIAPAPALACEDRQAELSAAKLPVYAKETVK